MPSSYYKRALHASSKANSTSKDTEKLLDTGDNQLTLVMLTDAITAGSVIKKAKQNVEALLSSTG